MILEKLFCFLVEYLLTRLDRYLFYLRCSFCLILENLHSRRSSHATILEKCYRVDSVGGEKITTESLINYHYEIFSLRTSHIIVWMCLTRGIYLKMKMVSIGIPCISHFPDIFTHLNSRAFFDEDFGKMCVVGIYRLSVRKSVLDSDNISPSRLPSCSDDLTISDRSNRSSLSRGDIESCMTPISDIPSICISSPP